MSDPRRLHAFTLIELLTVIAIIGILAAIIIPTVGKVRQTARGAQCQSNLRQLAQAMILHAGENKGVFVFNITRTLPNNQTWADQLNPYIQSGAALNGERARNVFACPASEIAITNAGSARSDYAKTTYINNTRNVDGSVSNGAHVDSGLQTKAVTTANLPTPSRVIALMDSQIGNPPTLNRDLWNVKVWDATTAADGHIAPRHGDRAQAAYYDGSVRKFDHTDTNQMNWRFYPWTPR
ncbi:MAG: prepilin-type N-terminal cleavage/methylation domain-containing protein [Burkholderiales bacterium]|nr:prepilin-type N-terminal cleavage/methylation domain-containing protein [Opitutaceae bacterium]